MGVAAKEVFDRMAILIKQARIEQGRTQAEQADKAEISLRAAHNIEAGEPGQTAILFRYLQSLSLLDHVFDALPDPAVLTPLEELAVKEKIQKKRPQRVSKPKKSLDIAADLPKWGDA